MKKLTVEGKILSVGRTEYDPRCKIVIGVPVEEADEDEDEDEYRILEFEMADEDVKKFGSHIFDRVRVSFTVVPTPQVIDGEKEEEPKSECTKGPFRRPGEAGGIQDDDEAG